MNTFIQEPLKNIHPFTQVIVIKRTHFCFSWNGWNRQSVITFLQKLINPLEIIKPSLYFPNFIILVSSKRCLDIVNHVRQSENGVRLFFRKLSYFDAESVQERVCFSTIVKFLCCLDLFVQRWVDCFLNNNKRIFVCVIWNVNWLFLALPMYFVISLFCLLLFLSIVNYVPFKILSPLFDIFFLLLLILLVEDFMLWFLLCFYLFNELLTFYDLFLGPSFILLLSF